MNLKLFVLSAFFCFTAFSVAQTNKQDVLFTVDGDPVKASEFIRVYNKNLELVKDESQKDVDEYLKLFINYKLKIKEAKRLGLDENANYKREFLNYKKQLTKNYLTDNKVTDALVKEAYDRLAYDVKVSHILFRFDASNTDTTAVYNDLLELRKRAQKEGFETVFNDLNANYKQQNSRALNYKGYETYAEHLGYFSAFKMVYDFENVAYNTNVGEVSMPFRSSFGYHILKVEDKRPSRGEVTVKHIMVSNKQMDSTLKPEVRINELYKKIEQGESFEMLAKQFSDDKSSSGKGGLLSPFKSGQLSSTAFEDGAFALKNAGDISEPFQSEYGWHIVKLVDKKPLDAFDVMKPELEQRVKRDSRSALINTALTEKLKSSYKITENEKALTYFETLIVDDFFKGAWNVPSGFDAKKNFLVIGNTEFSYGDFANHLKSVQRGYLGKNVSPKDVILKEYNAFLDANLIKYREDNLEFEDENFAFILNEYRDGLLLFDLMEKQVWNAAVKDTVGLEAYYNKNSSNYVWENRIDGVVATAAKKKDISKVIDLFKAGKTVDEINTQLNTDKEQKVIFTRGIMDTQHQSLPKDFEYKEGLSKIYNYNGAYHVIKVDKVLPKSTKTFEEAKGMVISDYQNYIEQNWLKSLNETYKVEVDNAVLEKVKSQILN
ncbi:peptidylprolyl isomerase [Gaetbulibacter sp. NE]|uniref:peptidylprolyl isomerase n=1 Tax=Gaetbulibacter sp. NE TaxID=2982307 RepID=UPI0021D39508|nr:peptidylprolyl isomerase [Gaetbulibacter sp. NE]